MSVLCSRIIHSNGCGEFLIFRFLICFRRLGLKPGAPVVNFSTMLMLLLKSPPPAWLAFVLAGAVTLIVTTYFWARRAERKRREAFSGAAMQIGFSFEPVDQPFPPEDVARFHLLTAGHGKEFRNVLRGRTDGKDTVVFDYKYVTGGGKNQSTHRQTVAGLRLGGASFPGFYLQPENLFHKIAALFGYQDIDFPDHPEFSRRYLLRGDNESAIRTLFSPTIIDMFESLSATRWSVEGSGEWLLVYNHGCQIGPAELPQFLQATGAVAASFGKSTGAAKFGF